ncbi:hypothetical protein [Elizabethkingia miricola]|uniref:hypothetical protein n=1 Tax=Elizabethkingia miricola TaxID=172045 RepID=UPI000999CBAB|nr:hypothetical protein [Elizabethkingia miricola]OPC34571.1 hypothetical protein BAX99_06805 [Elizabethkingia miricola]
MCQQLHFSWEELHYKVPYNTILKIIKDLPGFDDDDQKEDPYENLEEEVTEDDPEYIDSVVASLNAATKKQK